MEISSLVSECHGIEFEVMKTGEKEKKQYKECEAMMNKHSVKVRELEKKLPFQVELEYLCSHMEELKTHSMYTAVFIVKQHLQTVSKKCMISYHKSFSKFPKFSHEERGLVVIERILSCASSAVLFSCKQIMALHFCILLHSNVHTDIHINV